MIKPEKLKKGDKVAVVSLSWGGLGDDNLIHKYKIAKERLENDFGLQVVAMPNALAGSEYVYNHPEARAKDLMDAFSDPTIKAIICAIGGDDSLRIIPYIDYDVIKNNPKIFMGYSDTTVQHFIMQKAGLVSYYGPCIMAEFGEYVKMFDYTKEAFSKIMFTDTTNYELESSKYWSNDFVNWSEENINVSKKLLEETHGYEVINGKGVIKGKTIGGCVDLLPMIVGTSIWPSLDDFKDKILFLETSEEKMPPNYLLWYLRNLGAQGILNNIKGMIIGKPQDEQFYEEYKEVYLNVINEFNCPDLPIIYNINVGHASPTGILPLGIEIEVDYDNKKIKFLESATK